MASSNSPFSSSGSVSSLVKNASSAAAKVQEFNDALAAYQYDNSTKSYADYVAYDQYLSTQASSATDPMRALTYQKKQDTARSGYISNEIQRQSIAVAEGSTSNIDKYNGVVKLYYAAAQAGQDDLAQSLRLQADNLSITIQNDQRAAIAANKDAAAEITKQVDGAVKDSVKQITDNANLVLGEYQKLGPQRFQQEYGSDVFSVLSNMVNSQDPNNPGLVQVYDQAARVSPDAMKIRDYQVKLDDLANGGKTGLNLPGVGDVSYKDLQDQAYAQSIGQTLFDSVDTGQGVQFTKNQTTGYAWGRDENGDYKLMPIYNPKQDLNSGIAKPNGKKGETLNYTDLLKSSGFEIVSGSSGNSQNLVVRNNGQFDAAGIPRGQQVQLYVDASGKLQLINGDKSYSLGFDQKSGKYVGVTAEVQIQLICFHLATSAIASSMTDSSQLKI
jgi:hypothetical protein